MEANAAANLLNRQLKTGWTVIEKIDKPVGATGSFFSVCYKVQKDDEICFLKAFDFSKFFHISQMADPARGIVDVMGDMLNAYRYERDLSNHCKGKHVTKVVFVRDAGEEIVEGFTVSLVPYLIFDLSDGDVRKKLAFSEKLDFSWKLLSLHDIAVGLRQLHNIEVSHQDLKPSNILVFRDESKLGDLGRSLCKNLPSPYEGLAFTGDNTYAPPEIMYKYYEYDWSKRVYAIDCYLLGSMVVFYFAGISMSALLMNNIPEDFRCYKWKGSFEEIKPYLMEGFELALIEFEKSIDDIYFKKGLRRIVENLCYPIPEQRGHPKNILSVGSNYNLERFVTMFDLLHKKAEYSIKS